MSIGPRPNGSAEGHVDTALAGTADAVPRSRVKKAPNAFRTISEVADDLHIPQHVLRFWETKFPQVRPLKRGGGRRYYRPDDIALLRRISDLLYIQGFTIKGVQRLLREGGGRLSDDIPPPTGDERRDLDAAGLEPELPLPGLMPPGDASGDREARAPPSRGAEVSRPRQAETGAAEGGAMEIVRLRRVLADTLAALEALRALLA